MTVESIDAVVIGAGVIGLACARALAACGHETLVLERNAAFGQETSSRNSEVIHAGFYYPTGTLKARFCAPGNAALYAYCAARGIAHRRCGKLVVATAPAHEARLAELLAQGAANGVTDLRMLSGPEAMALEPALTARSALFSPSTGIVDSHALMLALLADAERAGARLVTHTEVRTGAPAAGTGLCLQLTSGGEDMTLTADIVINAAGLHAPALAARIDGLPGDCVPLARYAKGSYFALSGRAPFSRLVYPVPEPGGLGVHLTLDLAGQARFGPDVEWVEAPDYAVDPLRAESFYGEVRKYWPALPDNALAPAYCGIRPKLAGPGFGADFVIHGPQTHGVPGLVNLFGIESPGLTSCLPIAAHVLALLDLHTRLAAL